MSCTKLSPSRNLTFPQFKIKIELCFHVLVRKSSSTLFVTLWYSSLGGSGHWSPGGKGTQPFSGTAVQCFCEGCPSVLLSEFRGLTSALTTGRPRKGHPECPFRGRLWSLNDDLGLYTCGLTRCYDSRLSHPESCTGRVWEEEDVNPLFPVG